MKFIFTLMMFLSKSNADSESELINSLISHLPYGLHKGKDISGRKCIVEVTKNESLPQPQNHKSKYQIEIFMMSKHGWFGWTHFRAAAGGYGDCTGIVYNTGTYVELKNSGSGAPCFSSEMKSNRKGLKLISTSPEMLDVITLNEDGSLEAKCTLKL